MITGDITHALLEEIKYFLNGQGTFILDTQIKDDMEYSFPLVILELGDAGESSRLPGNGISRIDYDVAFRVYNYEPNAYSDDDGGYSSSLLDIIDKTRDFFCNEIWQTNEMKALTDKYGFRMEFQGMNKAEPMPANDTMVMGYRLNFSTIGFDQLTNASYDADMPLTGSVTGTVVFQ
jgi:hypothetical protein